MLGEGFAACLLGAFGLRRSPPPPPPKAVLPRHMRVRQIKRGAPLEPVWQQIHRTSKPTSPTPDQYSIDSTPIDSRRSNRLRSVAEHVDQILTCFRHSAYRPGEAVDCEDMKAIYAHVCREMGWRPHKWNTFAAALRRKMAPGARGSRKPYRRELRDGVEVSIPIYILPEWTIDSQSTPRRPEADTQSTRQRRAA